MSTEQDASGAAQEETTPLPSFPSRVLQVFFSPGALVAALARNPAWGAALVLGMVVVLAQALAIPPEVWEAMFRETMLQQGREMPPGFNAGGTVMRLTTVTFGTLGYLLITAFFSGLVTLTFAFVLGDEGRFTQYLSILAHAWLIPAVIGLVLIPLKISQQNPQLTLNMGAFLFFLPKGYLLKFATLLDLSQVWAWLIVAQGATAVDSNRSFRSAATILLAIFIAFAAVFAIFVPMP